VQTFEGLGGEKSEKVLLVVSEAERKSVGGS